MQLSYQQNDVNNGTDRTTTSQDRFSFYFNLNSNPFSRLTMAGVLRLDVLEDNRADGTSATELQPNVDVRLSTKAAQLGVGYRQIIRNENIIAANVTQTLTSNSTDSYVETNIIAGKLPSLRLRYSLRDESQNREGVLLANTNTADFLVSTNYRLGIFIMNADYRDLQSKDKVGNVTGDTKQITGQVSFSKRLGTRIDLGLRENYSLAESSSSSAAPARQSTSIAEARANFNLFKGAVVSSSYVYRVSDDITAGTTTERTFATTVNYALPKFIRFYGSYVTREADSPDNINAGDNTIAGVSFNHAIGRFTFASRYEMRFDTTSVTTGGITANTSTTQDNLDWALTARPARYLGLLLSESYVSNTNSGTTTDSNHFRLRADIGPVKAITLGPYVEYTINSSSGVAAAASSTNTAFVVPGAFHINLHQRLDFSITDTYNLNITETAGSPSTRSQNNNAVLRLALARPFPNGSISGDASFSTSSTDTSPTISTSTYTLRAGWARNPHILNVNVSYQEGSNTPSSVSLAGQYGLNFRLKKLSMGFQARYDYSMVMSTPSSSSQTIYVLLNLRK